MLPGASGPAANEDAQLSSWLDGELGFAIAMFGGDFTGTSHVGFGLPDKVREYHMRWRLRSARQGDAGGFEVHLDGARREAGNNSGVGAPEHCIGVGLIARW